MEQEIKIEKTAAEICDSLETLEKVDSLAKLVAEMIVRGNWAAYNFKFKNTPYGVVFRCRNSEQNLSGYQFAYQVKCICSIIEKEGYYD